MKYALITLFSACTFASASQADDVVPEVLLAPVKIEVPGRQIDIRGLVPGMSLEEVVGVLTPQFGSDLKEMHEKTAVREAGVLVTSVPFVKIISGRSEDEEIMAMLTGIGSGNQAVYIGRELDYGKNEDAPIFDSLIASVIEKYGEPTNRRVGIDETVLFWTFKNGEQVHCELRQVPQCLEANSAMSNASASSKHFDVIISVEATRSPFNAERVELFETRSIDLGLWMRSEEADEAGLKAVLDAAVDASRSSAQTPAL